MSDKYDTAPRKDVLADLARLQQQFKRDQDRVTELAQAAVNRDLLGKLRVLIGEVQVLSEKYKRGDDAIKALRADIVKGKGNGGDLTDLSKEKQALLTNLEAVTRQRQDQQKQLAFQEKELNDMAKTLMNGAQQKTSELVAYEASLDNRLNALATEYVTLTGSVADMNAKVQEAIRSMRDWSSRIENAATRTL